MHLKTEHTSVISSFKTPMRLSRAASSSLLILTPLKMRA